MRSCALTFLAACRLASASNSYSVLTTLYCPGAGFFSFFPCLIISSTQVIFSPCFTLSLTTSPHSSLLPYFPGPGTAPCIFAQSSRKFPRLVTCLRLFSPFLILSDCRSSICLRGSKYLRSIWQPSMPPSCWLVERLQISLGVRLGQCCIYYQLLILQQAHKGVLMLLFLKGRLQLLIRRYNRRMKQIITLNFGQPGLNISDQTLSLYAQQHGMSHSTQPPSPSLIDGKYNQVFFDQSAHHKFNYRAISVDCDPYSTNELLKGRNRDYYKKEQMVTHNDSTGGFYSRGYAIANRELGEKVEDAVRRAAEGCDNLQGIMVNVALLGGAAGVFHQVLGKLAGEEHLRKKVVVSSLLFPSQRGNSIVDIYNYCLSFRALIEHSHLNIPYDNDSLYRLCEQAGIESPSYSELNHQIANVQSSLTLSMRCTNSIISNNLNEMTTNLVCYPRISLVYPSATPLICSDRFYDSFIPSADALTRQIFQPSSRLLNMHGLENKIAVGLYYRGEFSPYEVQQSLSKFKQAGSPNLSFQQWSPLGLKVGINPQPSLPHYSTPYFSNNLSWPRRSCCSLTSAMQFNKLLAFNNHKFDLLYAKRAYVYTFIQQSMEEGEFSEAREDLAALQKDYETWECVEEEEEE